MRIKVLHVAPDLMPHGLERIIATLAARTDRSGFEVGVVSLYGDKPGSLGPAIAAGGAKVFHLGKRPGFDVRMFGRLARLLEAERPDIIHSHNYVVRYTWPCALRTRVPVQIHTIHNVADKEVDKVGLWLQKMAFRRTLYPVSIAQAVTRSFERTYGMECRTEIPNGIEIEKYLNERTEREAWRRAEGFAPKDLLITCVARLARQKNHAALIEAFAAGPARLGRVKLLLAGDGELQNDLERLTQSLGVADKVRFMGRREDVPAMLGASDIFALASLWEGNPLSVMEAMAAGLPVVASGVGAIPELVDHEKTGLVISAGDAGSIAEALTCLCLDEAARCRFGMAAAERAKQRFDSQHMVRAYEELYRQLMPGGGEGRRRASVAA